MQWRMNDIMNDRFCVAANTIPWHARCFLSIVIGYYTLHFHHSSSSAAWSSTERPRFTQFGIRTQSSISVKHFDFTPRVSHLPHPTVTPREETSPVAHLQLNPPLRLLFPHSYYVFIINVHNFGICKIPLGNKRQPC